MSQSESESAGRSCPKCRNKNPISAAFCGFCGADLRSDRAAGSPNVTMFGYAAGFPAPIPPAPAALPVPAPLASSSTKDQVGEETHADKARINGRYELVGDRVRTAVGAYCRARDSVTDRVVIINFSDPALKENSVDLERSQRDTKQLCTLRNDNVAKILESGIGEDGNLFVVLDNFDAGALRLSESIATLPWDVGRSLRTMTCLCKGLMATHSLGIVHRDIGPHNIVVSRDGVAKIIHDGIFRPSASRPVGLVSDTGDAIASPLATCFRSPEEDAGRPPDQRSNIYSIGAIFYLLLSGRPPFSGVTDSEPRANRVLDRGPLLKLASPKLVAFIEKALCERASDRPLAWQNVVHDLEAIAKEQSSPRPKSSPHLEGQTDTNTLQAAKAPLEPLLSPPKTPVDATHARALAGEMSSGERLELRQLSETKQAEPSSLGKGSKGFRETMWFYQGEVESALAEKGEEVEELPKADAENLREKYSDDGSLSSGAADRLSLRTGRTQMFMTSDLPSGLVPGKPMRPDEMINEMNEGRKIGLYLGTGVAVLGLAALLVWWLI